MGYSLGLYWISICRRDQCANLGFGRFVNENVFCYSTAILLSCIPQSIQYTKWGKCPLIVINITSIKINCH